jgi:excisionase family DNA binding protein
VSNPTNPAPSDLLTPKEVGEWLRVHASTVTRWAKEGLLPSIRTPGGHRRYLRAVVEAIARGDMTDTATAEDLTTQSRNVSDLQVGDTLVRPDQTQTLITRLVPPTADESAEWGYREVFSGSWSATYRAGEAVMILPRPAAEAGA